MSSLKTESRAPSFTDVQVRRVIEAARAYDDQNKYYDDIFNATGRRLRQGFATKEDIAVISFWKAINLSTPWVNRFLKTDPERVVEVTRSAFSEVVDGDEARLRALEPLPGFAHWHGPSGGAIPSTLLCCWNPDEYAVVDRRSRNGLRVLGGDAAGVLRYWSDVRYLRDLARKTDPETTARDIDKGLFMIGGRRAG
jgi:hypothetical protein